MPRYLLPLGIFLALAGLLWVGLSLNPREVPSPFIDKPAPDFTLPRLDDLQKTVSRDDMKGQVWLLNVWASWCAACRQEHPLLVSMARQKLVPIFGLNYKDAPRDARRWLEELGDPYVMSLVDMDGRVGIDYGVYGVPETFVIDKQGIIRHKVIGPVTPAVLRDCLKPLVKALQAAPPGQVVTRKPFEGCR